MDLRTSEPLPLPPGFTLEKDRTRTDRGERVLVGRLEGAPVVVRLVPPGPSHGLHPGELRVLARLDHPNLARLVDHGAFPDGTRYLVRAWIEGRDLATWWRARRGQAGAEAEFGAVVVRLAAALDHLHGLGAVHGDLKPENVIVRDDGQPVLTDFGFAGELGAERGAAGTPFYAAPEVLRGAPASPAMDLFALGATLVRALVSRELRAADLYSRFPAVPFLDALGVLPDELPAWARDVATALVGRDPARRGRSAGAVARELAGRLGIPPPEVRASIAVPALLGREDFARAFVAAVAAGSGNTWIRVDPREDRAAVARALRLDAAVAGARTRAVDPRAFDGLEPASAALAARAEVEARACEGGLAFLVADDGAVARAAALELARAAAARSARLVVVSADVAPPDAFHERELPPLDAASVRAWIVREVDAGEPGRVEALCAALCPPRSSPRDVDERLKRAIAQGWILFGPAEPRLRAGPAPGAADLAPPASAARSADRDEARLAAAFVVLGPRARLDDAARLAGLDARPFAARPPAWLVDAADGGLVPALDPEGLVADPDDVRAACARRAAEPSGVDASSGEADALRFALDGDAAALARIVAAAARSRESGAPARALDLVAHAERLVRASGRPASERLALERAFAWLSLGEPARARAAFDPEPPRKERALEAGRRALRAALAAAAGDPASALVEARAAADIDPVWRDARLDLEARAAFESGDDAGLEHLVETAIVDAGERTRANARNLFAASLQRRGELERARALYRELLDQAEGADAALRAAALSANLGLLERRAGRAAEARDLFERAVRLHERAGTAAGLAHARAQLAATLRDLGELALATDAARAAFDLLERLGDPLGAAVARGALGLVLLDRGHAHAAREELTRAAQVLLAAGRHVHAALLEARLDELGARLGRGARGAHERARAAGGALDADPRALVALARAAWMRGDHGAARERARRAHDLAASLRQEATRAEAESIVAALASGARRAAGAEADAAGASDGSRDDDARVLALLARDADATRDASFARELEARGRDDRAARVWAAIAARAPDRQARTIARAEAARVLWPCVRGLSADEARAMQRHLLARPDPRPADLNTLAGTDPAAEDEEMDVVRLLEINQRLVAEEAPEKLLGTIVEHALSVTGAERGFVVLEEEGSLVFDTARDSRRGDIDEPELEVSRSVVTQALERGAPVLVSNAVEDPELFDAPSVVNLDLRSILCVPFSIDEHTRGVVYVDNRVREGAFGPRAEKLLVLLAGQAALALRQVRRLAEIRRLNARLEEEVAHTRSDLESAQEALREVGAAGVATGLVGRSAAIRRVHERIARAAQAALPVLVSGPSGTGKELAARALHAQGPRASGPIVIENCAALPAALVEAELFGAARGAYTGADVERAGLFERANGGTLFLDEIGELPLELQAKLLRVLETSEVRRLGEARVRRVDFRLVAATNRDLEAEVRAGRFRADLYYRLDGLRIEMPPLSARVEDVPLLVEHFLRLETARGRAPRRASADVLAALSKRSWPGNVRELRNEVARLCVLCPGDLDDPSLVRPDSAAAAPEPTSGIPLVPLADLERMAIEKALEAAGGDKARAAEMLGISRAKVYQRLQAWRGYTG